MNYFRIVMTFLVLSNTPEVLFGQSEKQPIFTRKIIAGPVPNPAGFEFIPTVTADGLTMIYSSTSNAGGVGNEDMWMATRSSIDEPFGSPVNLTAINSTEFDDVGSLSADGLTLYFGSNRSGENWDIYTATRPSINGSFTDAQKLPGVINTDLIENSPRVTADGLAMVYQVANRETREREIRLATRGSINDEFGNSIQLDLADTTGSFWPSISADRLLLVTADQPGTDWPNRAGGEGGEDIWVATRANVGEPFSEPQNPDDVWPGSQINSIHRQGYPFLTQDWPALGAQLYFVEAPSGTAQGQIIQMTWMVTEAGDVNLDGWKNIDDLGSMCIEVRKSRPNLEYDLNGDQIVDLQDMEELQSLHQVLAGDIDYDGDVDFEDFLTLSNRFGRTVGSRREFWRQADFDCSARTDFGDFLALSGNFEKTFADTESVANVPEPDSLPVSAILIFIGLFRSRSLRQSAK